MPHVDAPAPRLDSLTFILSSSWHFVCVQTFGHIRMSGGQLSIKELATMIQFNIKSVEFWEILAAAGEPWRTVLSSTDTCPRRRVLWKNYDSQLAKEECLICFGWSLETRSMRSFSLSFESWKKNKQVRNNLWNDSVKRVPQEIRTK